VTAESLRLRLISAETVAHLHTPQSETVQPFRPFYDKFCNSIFHESWWHSFLCLWYSRRPLPSREVQNLCEPLEITRSGLGHQVSRTNKALKAGQEESDRTKEGKPHMSKTHRNDLEEFLFIQNQEPPDSIHPPPAAIHRRKVTTFVFSMEALFRGKSEHLIHGNTQRNSSIRD
jgi:hypothetical protein